MSAVTLETLRADYDAAGEALYAFEVERQPGTKGLARRMRAWEPDYLLDWSGDLRSFSHMPAAHLLARWHATATQFVIARDYGLEAAMLWKLSDGAIDPRKSGVA